MIVFVPMIDVHYEGTWPVNNEGEIFGGDVKAYSTENEALAIAEKARASFGSGGVTAGVLEVDISDFV